MNVSRATCLSVTLFAILALLWSACGSTEAGVQDGAVQESVSTDGGPDSVPDRPAPDQRPTRTVFGGSRPVTLKLPPTYDHGKSHPLVVLLHGYGASGDVQYWYLKLSHLVEKEGVLLLAPDGTEDSKGKLFWNATDVCCNFEGKKIDDVGYIKGLIQEVSRVYNVDRDRIYLIGHSNGGYMSYRMACEVSELLAGIVSLAGATYAKRDVCKPSVKVSVLQIHGTKDSAVKYEGGSFQTGAYPSAEGSVKFWGGYNGCTGGLVPHAQTLDLDVTVPGHETTIARIGGCPKGVAADLWTIKEGGHLPMVTTHFPTEVWRWMKAHPKARKDG